MDLNDYADKIVARMATVLPDQVTADPRDLRVPGVLVGLAAIRPATMADGSHEVDWDLVLLAAGSAPDARQQLGVMLTALEQLHGLQGVEWEAGNYLDPNLSTDPLPALTGTLTLTLED